MQICTSIFINILALTNGANFGIPNIIFQKMDKTACMNNETIQGNKSIGIFDYCYFTVDDEDKSLIGKDMLVFPNFNIYFAIVYFLPKTWEYRLQSFCRYIRNRWWILYIALCICYCVTIWKTRILND